MTEQPRPTPQPQRIAVQGVAGFTANTDDVLHDLDVDEAEIDLDDHKRRSSGQQGGRGSMPVTAMGAGQSQGASGAGGTFGGSSGGAGGLAGGQAGLGGTAAATGAPAGVPAGMPMVSGGLPGAPGAMPMAAGAVSGMPGGLAGASTTFPAGMGGGLAGASTTAFPAGVGGAIGGGSLPGLGAISGATAAMGGIDGGEQTERSGRSGAQPTTSGGYGTTGGYGYVGGTAAGGGSAVGPGGAPLPSTGGYSTGTAPQTGGLGGGIGPYSGTAAAQGTTNYLGVEGSGTPQYGSGSYVGTEQTANAYLNGAYTPSVSTQGTLPGTNLPGANLPGSNPTAAVPTGSPTNFATRPAMPGTSPVIGEPVGSGTAVTVDPGDLTGQANLWEDWASRMAGIRQAIAETQAETPDFGMIAAPAPMYGANQTTSQQWTTDAATQFSEFADALAGTAKMYVTTESAGAESVRQNLVY